MSAAVTRTSRSRRARALVPLLALASLTGCYAGPPTDAGQNGNGVPFGVAASPASPPPGVYLTTADDDQSCCWLARDADFRTVLAPGTRRVRVTVELPAIGPYDQRPMDETVAVDGRERRTFRSLRSGVYALDVAVPPPGRERPAEVRMTASYTWTGAEQHLSGDTRPVTVRLRSVRAE